MKFITIEPGKRGGKPCIRGMRITVDDVLGYMASGMTQEQIIEDFPELTKEDIQACIDYKTYSIDQFVGLLKEQAPSREELKKWKEEEKLLEDDFK
ncbi:MAG TPA: DUF433 domain-containing protein [Saprospiraceae bacterium]|nr:DUF433 domain-containing protein [Saprospiraceae bacterium]